MLELPQPNSTTDIYLLEPRIKDKYFRYSNNLGFISAAHDAEIAHAFSHWSFEASKHRVMITDLQGTHEGKAFTLTDPAVHCPVDVVRFNTTTNQGMPGIEAVLNTHECGPTCKALGLPSASKLTRAQASMGSLAGYFEDLLIFD